MAIRRILLALIFISAGGQLCAQPFTGNIPLPTLGPDSYQGFQGGLYPGGSNQVPVSHGEAARIQAAAITPLDALGNADGQGKTGFITIGMSNTTQEFKVFERFADLTVSRRSRVVLVNTAQSGQTADVIADPDALYWRVVQDKLAAAGLSNQQVQVAWVKLAQRDPVTTFPEHARALQGQISAALNNARDLFPNLRIAFLSSRVYGGYSDDPQRGEPLSYETGFSVKWLIEEQINGAPQLNFDPAVGPVEAPLLLWGPYLWADGINESQSGLRWLAIDFEADGVHPSLHGELKVGRRLTRFFDNLTDFVRPWWQGLAARGLHPMIVEDDATVDALQPGGNFGGLPALSTGNDTRSIYLRFDTSRIPVSDVLHAKLSLRSLANSAATISVDLADDSNWDEHSITANNAPLASGNALSEGVLWSRDSSPSFDLTDALRRDDDGIITVVITRQEGSFQELAAKENWHGGRPALFVSYKGQHRPDVIHRGEFELRY